MSNTSTPKESSLRRTKFRRLIGRIQTMENIQIKSTSSSPKDNQTPSPKRKPNAAQLRMKFKMQFKGQSQMEIP